jgi:sugar lactone lactonase YvrE
MKPAAISRRTKSAQVLVTGAAAALTSATVLASGAGAATAPRGAGAAVTPGTINTVAGGVGGPGKATTVALDPCGLDFSRGNLHVVGGATVRKISQSDQLTTPAGTGAFGPAGIGGPATKADIAPCAAATDPAGNLVLTDLAHRQIDVVPASSGTFYGQAMTAGHIYRVAGNGNFGYPASGVPAATAPLGAPDGVAVDGHGNLVISTTGHGSQTPHWSRVQVVAARSGTFYGQAMTAGDIYLVAGGGPLIGKAANGQPATQAAIGRFVGQVAVDPHGNLLVAGTQQSRVWLVAAATGTFYGKPMTAGNIYTISAAAGAPLGVTTDAAGNAVVAEGVNEVRVIAARSGTFYGQAMTTGNLYVIAGTGTAGFSGDGGPATAADLKGPNDVAVDPATGNVLIADTGNGAVRVLAGATGTFYGQAMTTGDIYTIGGIPANGTNSFSGDGGPATRAQLAALGVTVDHAGNQVIADDGNNRIRVVAAATGTFYGQAMTAGDIYTVAGDGTLGFAGDGGPAASAELSNPEGVAVDAAGNLVIADSGNQRLRVVAATTGTFYGQAMTKGHIYTVAGDGSFQYSGDGGPATSAGVSPTGVAVDPSGNLVIGDSINDRIRLVAVKNATFYGQAMTAGHIYTVAGDGNYGFSGDGGPATSAELASPEGIAVDGTGNLVIGDTSNQRIRVAASATGSFYGQAMTAGHIYTVAGDGTFGFSGDGGPATSAELSQPGHVAVDAAGNLLIVDADNGRVRVVAARTGTFYQQAMTKGHIYTVVGNGVGGFSGDGGPATQAGLDGPEGIAVDGHGDLLISDSNRIRMVTE